MSRRYLVAGAAAMLLVFCAAFAAGPIRPPRSAAAPPPLKKGDRIVFLGDSITEGAGGARGYITLVKAGIDAKDPRLGVVTINAGISGDAVPDLQARLAKDVLAKKPTIVFIYIGINDVWRRRFGPQAGVPKEQYEAGLKDIVGRIKAAGAQPILCTPSVIGERAPGTNPYDRLLDEYSQISRNVAKGMAAQLLDLRKAFQDYLKVNNKEDREGGISSR